MEESHQKGINQLFMEPLFEEQVKRVQSQTCSNFFKNRAKLESVEELQGEVEIDNFCEMEKNYLNKCGNKEEESHQQEVNQLGLKTHVKELSLNLDKRCKGK